MMIKKILYFLKILIQIQLFKDSLYTYEKENLQVSTLLLLIISKDLYCWCVRMFDFHPLSFKFL